MRSDDLFKAIGNIDEQFIDTRLIENIPQKKRFSIWVHVGTIAACVTIIIVAVFAVFKDKTPSVNIVFPSKNAPTQHTMSADSWADMPPLYYADLANLSYTIVIADVTSTFREETHAYANVSVLDVLKGDVEKGDILCVKDNGFYSTDIPDIVYSHSGGPLMESGNRVLLFLIDPHSSETTLRGQSYYSLAEQHIGVFFYDIDKKYHAAETYAKTVCAKSFVLYDLTPKTIDEILTLIEKGPTLLSEQEIKLYREITHCIYESE